MHGVCNKSAQTTKTSTESASQANNQVICSCHDSKLKMLENVQYILSLKKLILMDLLSVIITGYGFERKDS